MLTDSQFKTATRKYVRDVLTASNGKAPRRQVNRVTNEIVKSFAPLRKLLAAKEPPNAT